MTGQRLVVKIGGKAAEIDTLITAMSKELRDLVSNGSQCVLVHGGGTTISELQGRYNITPHFVDGLRQTPPEEMPLVDMALAGRVNKRLVRLMRTSGLNAWGLCGADAGIITAKVKGTDVTKNRTGEVVSLNTAPLELLLANGYFPVIAPPSTDSQGWGININADEAALALASSLHADHLIFFSDVPGVLENGTAITKLGPDAVEHKISDGTIAGGMIPKVRSAAAALSQEVGAVYIGEYTVPGSLARLLAGDTGTAITKK